MNFKSGMFSELHDYIFLALNLFCLIVVIVLMLMKHLAVF